jgi:hypothetical protein
MSYPVKRQYKRGMGVRNTTIHAPYGKFPAIGLYYHALLTDAENYTRITDATFGESRSVIPRRDRGLFYTPGGIWDFWYRNQCVARVIPADGTIQFTNLKFKQELFEVSHSALLASFTCSQVSAPIVQEWVAYKGEEPQEEEEFLEPAEEEEAPYIVTEEDSFRWLMNICRRKAEHAIERNEVLNVHMPSLEASTRVILDYDGMLGQGRIYVHYSPGNDVDRWIAAKKWRLLMQFLVKSPLKEYKLAVFLVVNRRLDPPAASSHDIYVMFQRSLPNEA